MTWALFLSGVPTTLASQWKIPSYATARLMPRFYENIGQNMSKAEAWRRARCLSSLRIRHTGSNP